MDSRGQIEIMGLLLIIVLFALGMLIALYFVLTPDDTSESQNIKDSIVASNMISTLRKTSTSCYDRSVQELLTDCARTGGALDCGSGSNTCQVADTTITQLLDAAFDEFGREYYFTITRTPYFENIAYGTPCPAERETQEEPVPVGVGYDIILKLDICR